MTLEEFKTSLSNNQPPTDLSQVLQALWQEAKGDWDFAHRLAQSVSEANGSWVHAYLHRKEGDLSNAAYWYSRAGKQMPSCSLEEEWHAIVAALL